MKVPRILHYPGSKWSMADWIISHMSEHTTYLETHFGSGAVLFKKPASVIETVNDLDGNVVNLFRVIRECPEELTRFIYWTPYSREEYYESYQDVGGGGGLKEPEGFWSECGKQLGLRQVTAPGGEAIYQLILLTNRENGRNCLQSY